ncbi:GNAT domain-containing protein [Aspergillus karnatakaensis]|uniref:GNAT family N-acetyltransferase n=1 Tax=Aspergillus karnatakaensis TaxID=1810916 RepID=UPI003CCCED8C
MTQPPIPNPNTTFPADAPVLPTQPVSVLLPEIQNLKPIYTDRLTLHPFPSESEDPESFTRAAEGIFRIRSSKEVTRWLYYKTPHQTVEETKDWMRAKVFDTPHASGAVGNRHFHFFITERDDEERKIVGVVGVNALYPSPSVGYGLHPDVWGKGYATEAVRGVVDAWWKVPRVPTVDAGERLFGATNVENVASFRVLQKAGFEVYEYVEYGVKIAFMAMKQPESGVNQPRSE